MPRVVGLTLFWASLAVVFYHWLLFPLLLVIIARFRRRREQSQILEEVALPRVTVAIAAWNEESSIGRKLENCLQFDYPRDRMEIIVGTDAVTDRTNDIVRSFANRGVRLHAVDERLGKSAVVNMLVADSTGDLVLLTDADVLMDSGALRLAVARFREPNVGVLLFNYSRVNDEGHSAEGLWDKYENWLKRLEGDLGAAVGVYGWAMLMRRSACAPIPANTINDDYVLGTRPFRWGYDAVYEPEARTITRVERARVEFTRKARISRGNLQAFFMMPDLFLPKYGAKAWVLFSHKFLRWVMPFLMVAIFVGSALLWSDVFFRVAFLLQLGFYITTPLVLVARGSVRKLLFPQYYIWANVALVAGYMQYFFGQKLKYNWLRTTRE
jgi:cellulose synthase/poly-beta-1,6-N-acetylglucosamine synthase-like glycosyltransferase